jgi:DNA-binding transcriptional ArsR family regulator
MLDLMANGEVGVSMLQQQLGVSKTNVSQHLAILNGWSAHDTPRRKLVYGSLAILK